MKRIIVSALIATLAFGSVACSAQTDNINTMNETKVDSPSNIRDFEENGWSNELMMRKPPFPVEGDNNTVTSAKADGYKEQSLYLWNKGNVPATTNYTVNNSGYYDEPDFIPYMTSMLVPENVQPKGAVLLCAGGAFAFRGDYTDSIPTAEELNKLGYQCFIVDYRLHPYTQQDGALDLQRAVRFVRKNADIYRINPKNIAVAGFSAGGIQTGEQAMNFKGDTNGTKLDSSYIPDELDTINADVAAVGIIYSFYGRLSVAEVNVDTLRNGNLPPTYVCYGTNEVFRGQIENHIDALKEAGVTVGVNMLEGYSHGFGANGNWCGDFDEFLMSSAFDNEPYIEPILDLDEPTIENEKIIFNVNTNIDTANIIVALYDENGVLSAVKTNTKEGEFAVGGGKIYSMKAFAWKLDTLEPITSSSVRLNITVPKSPLKEYLNNTMETADGTLHYTYYLPENYDESKVYPMLVTCPGWSSLFNTIETTPLTENRHARENAEVWTDLGGDMIIVSPSLTDWGEKSARQTIELGDYFINNFSVDTTRIYASGFSAGGETLSRVVDKRPDLFAAYLHCGSQWDGGYDNAANRRLPVYVAMAENDSYYHSDKAHEAYDGLKEAYEKAGVGKADMDNLLVLDLKADSYFDESVTDYHAGGYYIMQDKDIIKWMLGKRKSVINPTPTPVIFEPFNASSKIDDVINDDAFGDYGRLIFPANKSYYSGTTLGNLSLTWYNDINPDKTVEICNYLKEKALPGETIFYDIYTDEEKAADSAKKDTGLFFFKGGKSAKFAIVNAGGGFSYVGAMHDSFPHALELSKKGYNAFALIYRPGWTTAMEDLARAIAFIHEHADELGVDTTDYSLWGGSAGARMAATLGSYTTDNYGEKRYPNPAVVIMQYTGHSEVTGTEPPTYNCVGTSDGIASYQTMQNRINRIKANGTDTMIEIFDGLPHGFGLGEGTIAYGWLDNAVGFWENNMKNK